MAFPPNGDERQLWLPSDNAAHSPFTGKQQRPKGNVAVSSMNMRSPVPVPPQGFDYPVRQGPMTDYRPSGQQENRFQLPIDPIGGSDGHRSRAPVNQNEGGAGGKKCIGTGVFIPTGRRAAVVSVRNKQTNQARVEEKNVEEDSPELCLPAEWIY